MVVCVHKRYVRSLGVLDGCERGRIPRRNPGTRAGRGDGSPGRWMGTPRNNRASQAGGSCEMQMAPSGVRCVVSSMGYRMYGGEGGRGKGGGGAGEAALSPEGGEKVPCFHSRTTKLGGRAPIVVSVVSGRQPLLQ